MKKTHIVIVVVALHLAGAAVLYLYKTELNEAAIRFGFRKGAAESRQAGGSGPAAEAQAAEARRASAAETPLVEIPADRRQLIGVRTVRAAVRPLQRVVRTVGRIEYDERKLKTANTKIEGWIEKLHVDYTGRYVQQGEPLAEIYSPELVASQQEFLNLLRWAAQAPPAGDQRTAMLLQSDARTLLEAARQRLRLWDIDDEQIRKIETTGKPVRTLTVYSPASGYILQKMAVQGMRVMPGEKLFDIADLSSVWVISDIYEHDLPLVRIGQTARIGLSYFPGREFSTQVEYIDPALAGETRTAKARFTIPNPDGVLKPRMFTSVELKIGLGNRLAVPAEAVIDTGIRQIVYVDRGEGNFEPREVTTGLKSDDLVEVTGGIRAGERVASSANFLIDSEAQLKGVTALPGKRNR